MRTAWALLAITALVFSGCSSDDNGNGNGTTTGDGTTTGATTGPGTTGPAGNGTELTLTCTATVGGTGSGFLGAPGGAAYVGGCPFGEADQEVVLAAAELPTDCDPYQNPPDSGFGESEAATVGETYPEGTFFSMFCGPGGQNLSGTIRLQPTNATADP